jgi:uncharacterized protein YkwD
MAALEQELLQLHNQERARGGLAPLRSDAALVQVARNRAVDMASKNYFAHTSPSGETAFTLLARTGYGYRLAGENIARNNYPDPQSAGVAMSGFMNSPTHRANMLDAGYRTVGIGAVAGAGGMKYIAVVFAGQ